MPDSIYWVLLKPSLIEHIKDQNMENTPRFKPNGSLKLMDQVRQVLRSGSQLGDGGIAWRRKAGSWLVFGATVDQHRRSVAVFKQQ